MTPLPLPRPRRLAPLPAALLALAAWSAPCPADDPAPAPATDPAARALFDEVARAYRALPAYVDHGEFSLKATLAGAPKAESLKRALAFARPNKIDLGDGEGQIRLVSDGKVLTAQLLKRYASAPAPEALTVKSIAGNPVAGLLLNIPPGLPSKVVLTLLTDDDPAKALLGDAGALRLEADRKSGEAASRVLVLDFAEGPDLRMVVDPGSKLATAMEFVLDDGSKPKNAKLQIDSIAWSAGAVSTAVPPADAFAFKAPEGATKVDTLADLTRGLGGGDDLADEWVGKPSPDFALTLLDGPGKTKSVSKADLAGKVVLLDFWATWCGPCRKELPEIQGLVDSYARRGAKDLAVVALSQDQADDAEGPRKLVESALAEDKLDLARGGVGRVGLDPEGVVARAFRVTGLPTLVLLDGKGVVRAVHVGYDPSIRETLTGEIDALRDGKPAPGDKKD